ncbi:triple functional domain protein [Musca domestica]|uniref:Triple functional domain protein n=1 Tax=Musca domestica TaxID=7370 RepID=A0ABM3VKU9_MUSDO|nr:triple functional domain protein [Musca domestica]
MSNKFKVAISAEIKDGFKNQNQLPTISSDPIALPLIGNNYTHPPLFEFSTSNGEVRNSTSQEVDNLSDADQYNKPLTPTTPKKEQVINQEPENVILTNASDPKYKSTGDQLDLNNGLQNSIYGKNDGNATQKSFLFPISVPKVPEEVRNKRFLTPAFIKFMGLDDESESEEKKTDNLQTNKELQSAEKKLDNLPKEEESERKEVDLITSPVDTVSVIDTTSSKATEQQAEQIIKTLPTELKITKKEKDLPEHLERRKEIRRRKRPKTIASCQPSRDQMRADKENTTELEARRKDFASKQRVSFEDQSQPYGEDDDDFQQNDFASPVMFTNKISSRKEVPMVVSKRDSISELQTKTVTDELLSEVGKRPKRRHITRQQSRDDQSIGAKYVERKQDIDDDSSKTKSLVIIKNGTYQTMDPPADKYHSLKPELGPIEVLPSAEFCAKGMEHIQPILEELIKTEESYVESIWKGLKNYGNVFEQRDLPRGMKGKKYVLFGNIEQIAEFHRDIFLPMLLRNRNNIKQLFDQFQRYIEEDYFYAYVLYAMNNQRSLELCNENKKFFKTMQAKCEDNLGINSFLLQPIQRVPRYSLMLKEFIKKLFDKYPMKPLIDSCCRLDRRLQILLNAINKSEVINDVDCISETHEFNIFYQGKFRDVAEFSCHDFTLKRNYRSKLFIYEKCIIYTEVKRKQLVFRGRYPREHLGMTMQNKSFTLYYDRLKQQECEFVGDPALVRQWQDLIRDTINAYAVEEKVRLQELHNPEVVHRRQRRAANLSLFRDSNRFSTDSGISNT